MSKFLQLIKGASRSNTIRGNGIFLSILGVLSQTEFFTENPEYATILSAIVIVFNLFQRTRTSKPLAER